MTYEVKKEKVKYHILGKASSFKICPIHGFWYVLTSMSLELLLATPQNLMVLEV